MVVVNMFYIKLIWNLSTLWWKIRMFTWNKYFSFSVNIVVRLHTTTKITLQIWFAKFYGNMFLNWTLFIKTSERFYDWKKYKTKKDRNFPCSRFCFSGCTYQQKLFTTFVLFHYLVNFLDIFLETWFVSFGGMYFFF